MDNELSDLLWDDNTTELIEFTIKNAFLRLKSGNLKLNSISKVITVIFQMEEAPFNIIKTLIKYADLINDTNVLLTICNGYDEDRTYLIAKLLLDSDVKIDLNMQDKDGKTALMYACDDKNSDLIKLLLSFDSKIDINLKDNNGKTALFYLVDDLDSILICGTLILLRSDLDITTKTPKELGPATHIRTGERNISYFLQVFLNDCSCNQELIESTYLLKQLIKRGIEIEDVEDCVGIWYDKKTGIFHH